MYECGYIIIYLQNLREMENEFRSKSFVYYDIQKSFIAGIKIKRNEILCKKLRDY